MWIGWVYIHTKFQQNQYYGKEFRAFFRVFPDHSSYFVFVSKYFEIVSVPMIYEFELLILNLKLQSFLHIPPPRIRQIEVKDYK